MVIYITLFTPVIGIIILFIIDNKSERSIIKIKQITLNITIICFIISLFNVINFDNSSFNIQSIWETERIEFINFTIGIDGLNLFYVILTTFLTPICILASWNVKHSVKFYIINQLIIEFILICLFIVQDILVFYISFEAVLIPLFILVGYWGGSDKPEVRARAALLLFLYTFIGSLFILLAVVEIYNITGTINITILYYIDISSDWQIYIWICFFFAFAIKTPLVPVHIWLPRAHAEAPLAGSIILAGTVLKASTYGFLRVLVPIFPDASHYWIPFVEVICVITLISASLSTLRQADIKGLVAYSSVAHIAIVTLGIFSNESIGIEGGILLSLAHGFVSPALFVIVGGCLYDRYHTRVIQYYRGISIHIPIISVIFFIAICCNIGVPLSLNWLGELISLAGIFQQSLFIGIIGASSIVLSASYSIWLFARIVGGSWNYSLSIPIGDITRWEFIIVIPLLTAAILLGIIPNVIIESIHTSVASILITH